MYVLSIFVFILIISTCNYYFAYSHSFNTFLNKFVITIIFTFLVILIDGLLAFIVRKLLPEKIFSIDKKQFLPSKKEIDFYEGLGIRGWKDNLLELGGQFTSFSKSKLISPFDSEYVKRFIIESNYGIAVHFCGIVFGFGILLLSPKKYVLCIAMPVALVNVFYNFLSIFVLRYNLPKLHTLYRYCNRKNI
ncbi:MAG: hypothetical protein II988_07090 [Clostridia bacterium]|nr:hypothetical protein [Clostridia bacterium]